VSRLEWTGSVYVCVYGHGELSRFGNHVRAVEIGSGSEIGDVFDRDRDGK
jgi:hypothetical protein